MPVHTTLPLPYPVELSDDANKPEPGFVPKDGIDALFIILAQTFGHHFAELGFWIWIGDTPALFALACCSRANRYMAYVWCDDCNAHVLDPRRRLVTFPRERNMPSLVMCNDLCFKHSEEDSKRWTGPGPRVHYLLYGHPRTCVCQRCCVCRFHGYIMP